MIKQYILLSKNIEKKKLFKNEMKVAIDIISNINGNLCINLESFNAKYKTLYYNPEFWSSQENRRSPIYCNKVFLFELLEKSLIEQKCSEKIHKMCDPYFIRKMDILCVSSAQNGSSPYKQISDDYIDYISDNVHDLSDEYGYNPENFIKKFKTNFRFYKIKNLQKFIRIVHLLAIENVLELPIFIHKQGAII